MPALPFTQNSVALTKKRKPLTQISAPVYHPLAGEVTIRVEWTVSTPLDLHRADGGLLIDSYPFLTGSGGAAGTIIAVGPEGDLKDLAVGDRVISYAFHGGQEANHQEYITVPAYLVSKVPEGLSLQEAVTVPGNLVTAIRASTADLGLELPWPIPEGWKPEAAEKPILIWGASSSVGVYALQVLKHWRYANILTVSSSKHHEYLKTLGARACFDYAKPSVVDDILNTLTTTDGEPKVPYILDCIGSLQGSLEPLSKVAQRKSRVAVMLPVVVKDATDDSEPEYEMGVSKCLSGQWADGVVLQSVRTHAYLKDEFLKNSLQPEVIPALLASGVVKPNKQRVIEGATMVERAQNALNLLRNKAVSGEKLVWRVSNP